ncbi:diacylglycerol kinase family protein [Streptomyces odontomachi]|uniref:diacylglycerol kinase family protein n=1 Tax=Streptomyces odontomachi TaxID=2944940 RepID=UPI00210E7249|nr:diacylglycerol kinase family protein [Streptomyces sp. ODS25]
MRIAKDVLSARAVMKLCLPDNPVEFARALARRGARHLVVVGDDRALLRAVTLLHREREPDSCALSLVPVGTAVSLAHSLGVPVGAVAAARAVLQGVVRRQDLLVDDGGGVVLGGLRIPPDGGVDGADLPGPRAGAPSAGSAADGVPPGGEQLGGARVGGAQVSGDGLDGAGVAGSVGGLGESGGGSGASGGAASEASESGGGPDGSGGSGGARRRGQSLVRTLAGRRGTTAGQNRALRRRGRRNRIVLPRPTRLRVEADGVPLVDVDQPVEAVRIAPGTGGLARVEIRPAGGTTPGADPTADRSAEPPTDPGWLLADARTVTVSGAEFHYCADMLVAGPVRVRTWTVRENAWGLTLPG